MMVSGRQIQLLGADRDGRRDGRDGRVRLLTFQSFQDGIREGKGKLTWADGSSYKGVLPRWSRFLDCYTLSSDWSC